MDPKYIIPSEKMAKNLFFSCFSAARPPRRLILWAVDPLIKYWELNFNFRYGGHLGFWRKWQKKAKYVGFLTLFG